MKNKLIAKRIERQKKLTTPKSDVSKADSEFKLRDEIEKKAMKIKLNKSYINKYVLSNKEQPDLITLMSSSKNENKIVFEKITANNKEIERLNTEINDLQIEKTQLEEKLTELQSG